MFCFESSGNFETVWRHRKNYPPKTRQFKRWSLIGWGLTHNPIMLYELVGGHFGLERRICKSNEIHISWENRSSSEARLPVLSISLVLKAFHNGSGAVKCTLINNDIDDLWLERRSRFIHKLESIRAISRAKFASNIFSIRVFAGNKRIWMK